MSEKQEALSKLPAKRVESILFELASLRRRANRGEKVAVPLVTLHLSNGRDIAGWIIDIGDDRHVPALILQPAGSDPRQPRLDATYLDRSKIDAITVHDAAEIASVLSFGEIDRTPGTPAPTRQELTEALAQLGRVLSEAVGAAIAVDIAWEGVPDTPDAMYSLDEALNDAVAAVKKIAEDPFGREELARFVRRIRLEQGGGPAVVREGELLRIISSFGAGKKGRLDRVGLIVAIGAEI